MSWIIFAVIATVVGGLYSLWVLPAAGWRRWTGAASFALVLTLNAAALIMAMGQPVPRSWRPDLTLSNSAIVAISFREPESILLWIVVDDTADPIALKFPWDKEWALALYKKYLAAAENDETLAISDGPEDELPRTHTRVFTNPDLTKEEIR